MDAAFRKQHPDGFTKDRYSCMRQKGEFVTSPHYHDCIELIYMEKGSMRVFYNGDWITVSAGEMILFPPGRIHCTDCRDSEAEKLVIGFESSVIAPSDGSVNVQQYLIPFYSYILDAYIHFDPKETEKTGCPALLAAFEDCLRKQETAYELYAHGLLLLLYTRLYRNWQERGMQVLSTEGYPLLWEVIQRVQTLYDTPLSPYGIADEMHVSYSWLNTILHRSLHMSFHTYLNGVRLREAEKRLLTTTSTVTEIAQQTGFGDSSYFIRQFRKIYGCTPLQYRLRSHVTSPHSSAIFPTSSSENLDFPAI